jgi:hypothetical protein
VTDLPYAVAIFASIEDWDEIQCMALAAAWGLLANGERLYDADDNPVRFQSYGAAISFVLHCARPV